MTKKGMDHDYASRVETQNNGVHRKELHMGGFITEGTHIDVVVQILVNSTLTVVGSYFLVKPELVDVSMG